MVGRHSSMALSATIILRPQVQFPSTPSIILQFVWLKLKWDKDENKQKEAEIGPFKKRKQLSIVRSF